MKALLQLSNGVLFTLEEVSLSDLQELLRTVATLPLSSVGIDLSGLGQLSGLGHSPAPNSTPMWPPSPGFPGSYTAPGAAVLQQQTPGLTAIGHGG